MSHTNEAPQKRFSGSVTQAFVHLFLGEAPGWYKKTIIAFLVLNALLVVMLPAQSYSETFSFTGSLNRFVVGWVLIGEFIFCLAMALKAYPLGPAGLLAIEAVALKMALPFGSVHLTEEFAVGAHGEEGEGGNLLLDSGERIYDYLTNMSYLHQMSISTEIIYEEVAINLPVLLLLMFMVAGIHFMKEGLLVMFSKLLTSVRSKVALSIIFMNIGAFLSAFLDALTVTAVIIAVAVGFYKVYTNFISKHGDTYTSEKEAAQEGEGHHDEHGEHGDDHGHGTPAKAFNEAELPETTRQDLENFRGFLRNVLMHAAIGTCLGGAMTKVGEPQNLIIAEKMNWSFADFFFKMIWITLPVYIAAHLVLIFAEKFKILGFGYKMPEPVYQILLRNYKEIEEKFDNITRAKFIAMFFAGIFIIVALSLHIAEVGIIGLTVIIFLTSMTGIISEHQIGDSFKESLPFASLLVVFFAIVSVINSQGLFTPIMHYVFTSLSGEAQAGAFFAANGLLSVISDNVFVATIYITEALKAFDAGIIDRPQLDMLAAATNMGTNIPSIGTPNGQAAFLFLLTSAIAPLIRLSYMEMVKLALPYTIVLSSVAFFSLLYDYAVHMAAHGIVH